MGSGLSATDSRGKLESTERHIFPFGLFMRLVDNNKTTAYSPSI